MLMEAELVDSRRLCWVWECCPLVCEFYETGGLSGDCDCSYKWHEHDYESSNSCEDSGDNEDGSDDDGDVSIGKNPF
jgi:hypothetical protein